MMADEVWVRGSGAVAMAAALALGRRGLRVALAMREPAAGRASDLRTYALNEASVALLHTLRVWDALAADARTEVLDMRVEGDAAGAALVFSAWRSGIERLAWIVDAGALEAALRAAVRFAPHVQVRGADAAPGAGVALTVHAEGRDAASRRGLGVEMPVHAYGQRGVAARLVADRPHAGMARQWFRSPDVLALLPFDRPQPGCSYGVVWSLPDERAAALLALPPADFEQALADATGGAAGTLRLAGDRAAWPLALAQADPVCGPGWVLLGDAAHLVHPLAGQGLNLGLADVVALDRNNRILVEQGWDTPAFTLALGLKDVRLAAETAAECDARMRLGELLERRFAAAVDHGLGEKDWTAVAVDVRAEAGLGGGRD